VKPIPADQVESVTVTSLDQVEHRYTPSVGMSAAAAAIDGMNHCDPNADLCTKTTCSTIGLSNGTSSTTNCTTTSVPTASASARPFTGIATELTTLDNNGQQHRFLILNDLVPAKFTVGRTYVISRDKKNQYLVSDDGKKWLLESAK
jgi:hypothetical protein